MSGLLQRIDPRRYKEIYYRIAKRAILNRIITAEERDIISRVGTRKEWAWGRHLLDLCEIITSRIDDEECEKLAKYLRYLEKK